MPGGRVCAIAGLCGMIAMRQHQRRARLCAAIALLRGIAMATETRERTNTAANKAERVANSDIAELSAKVAQQGSELMWIKLALGAMGVLLITLCGAILTIALQI